jgi:hypothetical protein
MPGLGDRLGSLPAHWNRRLRIVVELLAIAITVVAIVTGVMYVLAAPDFDHPYRGENAWRTFVTGSVVVSGLGAAAAGVLWLAWRHKAALDGQPDVAARFLAIAVATLPEQRHDWGAAMMAELSSLTDFTARWRFAVSSARAALFPPIDVRRPATGRPWCGRGSARSGRLRSSSWVSRPGLSGHR